MSKKQFIGCVCIYVQYVPGTGGRHFQRLLCYLAFYLSRRRAVTGIACIFGPPLMEGGHTKKKQRGENCKPQNMEKAEIRE